MTAHPAAGRDALLAEDGRAGRIPFDQQGDEGHERQQEDQRQNDDEQVHSPLGNEVQLIRGILVGADCRADRPL